MSTFTDQTGPGSSSTAAVNSPTYTICRYFWEKAKEQYPELELQEINEDGVRIIPIYPTSIRNNTTIDVPYANEKIVITYDDFIKQRTGPMKYFYPIKGMQALIKITSPTVMHSYNLRTLMYDLLDREDQAAYEINEYAGTLHGEDAKFWLHCINLYQVTYMDKATNLDDQRSVFSTDFVIKYDYHRKVADSLS